MQANPYITKLDYQCFTLFLSDMYDTGICFLNLTRSSARLCMLPFGLELLVNKTEDRRRRYYRIYGYPIHSTYQIYTCIYLIFTFYTCFVSLENLPKMSNFILSLNLLHKKDLYLNQTKLDFEKSLADRQTLEHRTAPKVGTLTFSLYMTR